MHNSLWEAIKSPWGIMGDIIKWFIPFAISASGGYAMTQADFLSILPRYGIILGFVIYASLFVVIVYILLVATNFIYRIIQYRINENAVILEGFIQRGEPGKASYASLSISNNRSIPLEECTALLHDVYRVFKGSGLDVNVSSEVNPNNALLSWALSGQSTTGEVRLRGKSKGTLNVLKREDNLGELTLHNDTGRKINLDVDYEFHIELRGIYLKGTPLEFGFSKEFWGYLTMVDQVRQIPDNFGNQKETRDREILFKEQSSRERKSRGH
jgi:hypothetical protein